jgi:hypothetical protein
VGIIGAYQYFYHGGGCKLEKDGVVCEFDYLPENGYPIKFSIWKFGEYIKTNPNGTILDLILILFIKSYVNW